MQPFPEWIRDISQRKGAHEFTSSVTYYTTLYCLTHDTLIRDNNKRSYNKGEECVKCYMTCNYRLRTTTHCSLAHFLFIVLKPQTTSRLQDGRRRRRTSAASSSSLAAIFISLTLSLSPLSLPRVCSVQSHTWIWVVPFTVSFHLGTPLVPSTQFPLLKLSCYMNPIINFQSF